MAKKRRAVPNFFTISNLISGILAILFSLTGKLEWASYCIFIAIVFDFFDGFMAGILKVKSDKGKQLDSLADIVTFGVAPGFLIFVLLHVPYQNGGVISEYENFYPFLAFIVPVFALFRLAKYNIDTKQTNSFIGVPTATMAIFFASFPLLLQDYYSYPSDFKIEAVRLVLENRTNIIILAFIFSILMVAPIPLIALKFKHYKWKGNEMKYILILLSIVSIIVLKVWSVPVIVGLYILLSLINNVIVKSNSK